MRARSCCKGSQEIASRSTMPVRSGAEADHEIVVRCVSLCVCQSFHTRGTQSGLSLLKHLFSIAWLSRALLPEMQNEKDVLVCEVLAEQLLGRCFADCSRKGSQEEPSKGVPFLLLWSQWHRGPFPGVLILLLFSLMASHKTGTSVPKLMLCWAKPARKQTQPNGGKSGT